MNVICIGDIVGRTGVDAVEKLLPTLRMKYNPDVIIVNGENSADSGVGINRKTATRLFSFGIDAITTGNHSFRSADYVELFESSEFLIRPLNYPKGVCGKGSCIIDKGSYQIVVVNIIGQSFMGISSDNPYNIMENIIKEYPNAIKIVDFHAESTSEKLAFANCFDGEISALFGTHTHVETADARIFEKGTGYITDAGMVGAINSVIGVKIEQSIKKQRFGVPVRFSVEGGEAKLCGVSFNIDLKTKSCVGIERICELTN